MALGSSVDYGVTRMEEMPMARANERGDLCRKYDAEGMRLNRPGLGESKTKPAAKCWCPAHTWDKRTRGRQSRRGLIPTRDHQVEE